MPPDIAQNQSHLSQQNSDSNYQPAATSQTALTSYCRRNQHLQPEFSSAPARRTANTCNYSGVIAKATAISCAHRPESLPLSQCPTGYLSCGDGDTHNGVKPCEYRITAKAAATAGDATFTIPYTSTSGATLDAQVTVKVSNIAFTAPDQPHMAAGETLAISAGSYATDGTFTITCADATSISTEFSSVSRTANTCNYSAVAGASTDINTPNLHQLGPQT